MGSVALEDKEYLTTSANHNTALLVCIMMTSSNGSITALLVLCDGNLSVTGGLSSQMPAMRNFDVFFDLSLNKPLSK